MATASRDLRSHVTDVVTCPICLELFNSPKSLPCLHTFCLKCIEGHCRDNEPGDEVACPVCRKKFKIPESGIQELVSNFFITSLVEARKTTSDIVVPVSCEVCVDHSDKDDSNVPASTMYCVDCNQKLCDQCSRPHRKMKGGSHKVVTIGTDVETDLIQMQGGKCDKHKNECVKLFCFDCKMNICVICFAEEHQQHKCKNVETVAAECCKQTDADIGQIGERADVAHNEINRLDDERRKFVAGVEEVGEKILERGEELKQLIDKQVNELMAELQVLKTEKCKEIESHKDNIELKLVAFETFSAYCSELKSKGKPCDITRAANDLHTRANELLQNDVTVDYYAPAVTFRPMNIHELLVGGQNLVGVVKSENMHESNPVSTAISLMTEREKTLEQHLSQSVETERSLRQQIEVCNSQLTNNVNTWTQKVNELQAQVKQLKELEIEMKAEKVESEKAFSELTVQCEQLRNTGGELRVKLGDSEKAVKTLEGQLQQLRTSENELGVKLFNSEKCVQDLEKQLVELGKSGREHKSKLEMSEKSVKMLEEQCEQLRNRESDLRVELMSSDKSVKDLEKQREELNKSENQQKLKLQMSETSVKLLEGQCEEIRKNEAEMIIKFENSQTVVKKLEQQLKQLQINESEMKIKFEKSENVKKGLEEQLEMLRKSENNLKEEVKIATVKEKELKEQLKQVTDREQLLKDRLLLLEIVRRGCSDELDSRVNDLLHNYLDKRHGKEAYSRNEREEISVEIFEELKRIAMSIKQPSTPITERFTADLYSVYSAYPTMVDVFISASVEFENIIEEARGVEISPYGYTMRLMKETISGPSRALELRSFKDNLSVLPQIIVTRSNVECYDHRMIEELRCETDNKLRQFQTSQRKLCRNINVMRLHIWIQQLLLERVKELQKHWEEKTNPLSVLEADKETYIAIIKTRFDSESVRHN